MTKVVERYEITDKTRQLYNAVQATFVEWLAERGYALPADHKLIAAYLRSRLRRAPTTVSLHLSAISYLYRQNNWIINVRDPSIVKVKEKAKTL